LSSFIFEFLDNQLPFFRALVSAARTF